MNTIYLDHAATTYPKSECVYTEMDRVNRTLAVNAGRGSYAQAKAAVKLIDDTRKALLSLTNAETVAEVVLTASATIALNEITGGIQWEKGDVVYVSPYEHNAVARPLYLMQQRYDIEVRELPLKPDTLELDLQKTAYLFEKEKPKAVYASHVSNVTGYILPVMELMEQAKQVGAITVVDASQSLGLVPIDLTELKADYLVFAGHKTPYGPFGIGGFYARTSACPLNPYLAGGTGTDSLNLAMPQELPGRYEPASPNIVAAAGLLAALEELKTGQKVQGQVAESNAGQKAQGQVAESNAGQKQVIEQILKQEQERTTYLVENLQQICGVRLYLPPQNQQVGIVAFNIEGYQASEVGMILDEDYHIAVRTGYHCAPYIHAHLKDKPYAGVVRASIGRFTTIAELDALIRAVEELVEG